MRSADRPLLLLIVAAIGALGLWGKDYVAAGQESSGVRASVQTSKPTDGRPSVISAPVPSAAPITYWGTYKTTAFVLYRSNGPLREFIVKFDLPDMPNREGWR